MSFHTMNATIPTRIGDDVPVVVWFDYSPAERATSTYPGCSESVEIGAVMVGSYEHHDILGALKDSVVDQFEVDCLESMGQ